MQAKRVLVTGGTGFVGANLVRRLLAEGHAVHLLTRTDRQNWRIAEIEKDVSLHEGDIADREFVQRSVKAIRPEWVFHLAAHGAYSWQTDLERIVATNVTASMALADACAEAGVAAFVHSGSSSEYGWKDHPAKEDDLLEPNSPYAVTKAAATHYFQHLAKTGKLPAITLRLYSIYGPFEDGNRLIPTLLAQGLQGCYPPLVSPETARDFVYVDDAVEALLAVASAAALQVAAIFNVCSGKQTTVRELVEQVRNLLKIPAEPAWATMPGRSWDSTTWVGDPDAILKAAGWRAATSLPDGLRKTLAWLQSQPAVAR